MFNYVIDDITIASILDKRRAYANGGYPIRIRVNWRKNKKYYTTGKTCTIEMWDKLPSAKSKELIECEVKFKRAFQLF